MGILSSLFGIGGGGGRPSTQTVVQSQKIPEELSPFVKEILGEAQALYKGDIERGYDPYTGLTTAPFTDEQLQAQADLTGLRGTQAPFIQEALDIQREGAEKFTPEVAQEYMSPYQRAVTDIEKREAKRVFERDIMPRFEKTAVDAGGLSGEGTRATFGRSELQRNQAQLLADIEAKGLQSSFQDARQQFAQQKAREQTMAANIGRTGPALFGATLAEAGAAEGVGAERRELAQSGLDEAYFKFLEEQQYPQKTLAQYSGSVYGNPMLGQPSQTKTTTGTPYQPSMGQNLLGMGLAGLNIYGMGGGAGFGGTGFTGGNLMQNMYGGGKKMAGYAKGGGSVGMSDKNLGKYMEQGSGAISASNRDRLMRLYKSGLSGLPVVRRKAGDQVLDIFSETEKYIPETDLDVESSPYPLPVARQSMWPQADISLEEFQKRRPYLDPTVVRKVLGDQATKVSKERTKQETERKTLSDPLIQSLEKGRGAGSAARKSGAIFTGIANMMKNPAGTLVGLITSGGEVLSEIGKITREDAKFEADLAVKIFGIRKADLTEAHKAALQTIIEDGNVQKTLLELPGKAHEEYLDELVKRSTIAANEAKRIAAGKDKGKLTATVDKRLANMAAGAFGFQAILNEKGNLQIMDGDVLVSGGDNKKVTGKINKLLKAYGRNRKLGKDEATAIGDSFTEVFPGKPVPEIEEKVEINEEVTTLPNSTIPTFGGRPRPKKQ